jgi:hypothetical protein
LLATFYLKPVQLLNLLSVPPAGYAIARVIPTINEEPIMSAAPSTGDMFLLFNGYSTKVEIPTRPEYSLPTNSALTVSAWIRPDTLEFPSQEGTNYVHWMGKGETGKQEWTFRMYSYDTTDPTPRHNWISFYVFNPAGGRGTGSHEEDPVTPGDWIHIVGVADAGCTHLYKNGAFRDCDVYRDSRKADCTQHVQGPCDHSSDPVEPVAGDALLRIGTRDGQSYFLGGITKVRIWSRVLTDAEILGLYETDGVPPDGLVADFRLDADTGIVAVDGSSTANEGIITDGMWTTQ